MDSFLSFSNVIASIVITITLFFVTLLVIYLLKLMWYTNKRKWVWTPISSVERRNNLSYDEFIREYASAGKPVIITDAMKDWKASKTWNWDFFKSKYGLTKCNVQACHTDTVESTTIADYMDYMSSCDRDKLLYLSQWPVDLNPELYKDYKVPVYFPNWLERLPRKIRRKYNINPALLYIGPKGTYTPLHFDSWNVSTWMAMISGRKRFVFFSPGQKDFLYDGEFDAFNPDLDKFPLYANAKPVEVILEPGEIIYFPAKWWHQVANLEDSIAISYNLVDEWNSEIVFQYLLEESPIKAHFLRIICEFPWLGRVISLPF
jgi:hypothetical protein